MNFHTVEEKRVLAVDPTSRGFGFAVFEGPARLIDWGVKQANGGRNHKCVEQVEELIARYEPDVLIVEDTDARGSRRCRRVRDLTAKLRTLALSRRIQFRTVPRQRVLRFFAAERARTKHQIALAIAKQFPEIDPRLPPLRKPWMSEDERMSIFDAVALVLTFFDWLGRRKPARHYGHQTSFQTDVQK